jgi:hypothetical protein
MVRAWLAILVSVGRLRHIGNLGSCMCLEVDCWSCVLLDEGICDCTDFHMFCISSAASSIFFYSSERWGIFSLRFSGCWWISSRLLISRLSLSSWGLGSIPFLFYILAFRRRVLSLWLVSRVVRTALVDVVFFRVMMRLLVVVVSSPEVGANVGHLLLIYTIWKTMHYKLEDRNLLLLTISSPKR